MRCSFHGEQQADFQARSRLPRSRPRSRRQCASPAAAAPWPMAAAWPPRHATPPAGLMQAVGLGGSGGGRRSLRQQLRARQQVPWILPCGLPDWPSRLIRAQAGSHGSSSVQVLPLPEEQALPQVALQPWRARCAPPLCAANVSLRGSADRISAGGCAGFCGLLGEWRGLGGRRWRSREGPSCDRGAPEAPEPAC